MHWNIERVTNECLFIGWNPYLSGTEPDMKLDNGRFDKVNARAYVNVKQKKCIHLWKGVTDSIKTQIGDVIIL